MKKIYLGIFAAVFVGLLAFTMMPNVEAENETQYAYCFDEINQACVDVQTQEACGYRWIICDPIEGGTGLCGIMSCPSYPTI